MDRRPAILIEDDIDDKMFLEDVFSALEVKPIDPTIKISV